MRRLLRLIWLALIGIHVVLGATWVAQNYDTPYPNYGDTGDYLQLARTLEVDTYRGIAYPAFIAGVSELPGGAGLLRSAGGAQGVKVKAGVVYLQTIQLLASVAALAYFLRVLVARVAPPGASPWFARGAWLLFLVLLLFDPLVAHFDLSIMADGLALSASLAFCAALADFGLGSARRWLSGTVLLAAFVLTSSLRVEKMWVLACASLATVAAWLFLQRGQPREARAFPAVRALQIAGIVLAGSLAVRWLHRSAAVEGRRWPVYDSIVHARIVFPNLSKVYDELPPSVQKRISRKEALRHDAESSIVAFRIINDATGASGPIRVKDRREIGSSGTRPSVEKERRELLETIATVVLRERWAWLAADVLKDALENTAATFSFHVRLAVLARTGDVRRRDGAVSSGDGTQKTYEVLSGRHPRTSLWYVVSSVVVTLASAALALAAVVRRRRSGTRIERRRLLLWIPVAAFVLVNACAFALRADMVHIRYMLLAHVAFLALAYRGALEWLLPAKPGNA